jgi:endonuclease/exonuclease/phosphatase family metal-dependent hydrolase
MNIKFITLNLWHGGILFDEIVNFLREQDADIVVLQEVFSTDDQKLPAHFRSIESLRKHLDYPYYDFAPAVLDKWHYGNILDGNAVLSRFPITNRDITFFDHVLDMDNPRDPLDIDLIPVTPRNLQHVTLESPVGEINVFNFQGVWDLDGDRVSPQRQKMSDIIIEKTKGKSHVIVAGDTNAKHTNPVMRAIEEHLTSVFGDSLTTSFNMSRKDNPGYATAVVDIIYVSNDFDIVSRECPEVDISDHLPLVTTLSAK